MVASPPPTDAAGATAPPLLVWGAGAWGTALAVAAAQRQRVLLWARSVEQARQMQAARCNARYLPEVPWPAGLSVTADADEARALAARGGLTILGVPMAGLRQALQAMPAGARVLWLCKGFEKGTGALGHEVARAERPELATGVLSGPSFALETARGQPTALVAASEHAGLAEAAVQTLHHGHLRIYTSADPVGVEVGGAVKNVMAIATGIADGLRLGQNARAALITRGLAEITRMGVALGAQSDTFMGLSGLGDLVLTATGDLSRNRRVGLELASGDPLPAILERLGHVAEGVYTAATLVERARGLGVEMPISEAVVDVLDGHCTPTQALQRLMQREARAEA